MNKLNRRLSALVNLDWAVKYYQDGKLAESRKLIDQLTSLPLLPAEREIYNQLMASISAEETFAMVQDAIAKKEFDLAETWLEDLKVSEMTPNAAAKAAEFKAQLVAARK